MLDMSGSSESFGYEGGRFGTLQNQNILTENQSEHLEGGDQI